MFEDVPVRDEAEGSEHNDDRDLLSDVRQYTDDSLSNGTLTHSLNTI